MRALSVPAAVIDDVAARFSGRFALYAEHLGTGETLTRDPDAVFHSASTIKLAILIALYRRVAAGDLTLEQSVTIRAENRTGGSGVLAALGPDVHLSLYDLAVLMTIVSDNTATNECIDAVGIDYVNAMLDELGLLDLRLYRKVRPPEAPSGLVGGQGGDNPVLGGAPAVGSDNSVLGGAPALGSDPAAGGDLAPSGDPPQRGSPPRTDDVPFGQATPRSLGRLLSMLARGEAAPPAACEAVLSILRKQHYNTLLTRYLPGWEEYPTDGAPIVASKSGRIIGTRHDAGIVSHRGVSYVIVIMSDRCLDERYHPDNEALVELPKVSRAVFDYWVGAGQRAEGGGSRGRTERPARAQRGMS